jgi:hypothetical protein
VIAKATRDRVLDALWPAGLSSRLGVWMIVDAARDPGIYGAVHAAFLEKCCLYSGHLPWQLEMVAPYLIELRRDDRLTEFAIDKGWGQAWGIFVRTEADMRKLRRHLRGFLRVRDKAGRRLLFRYYDPRVMRIYLPTCTPDELRTVYGPVEQYLYEGEDPGTLLEYSFDGMKGLEKRISLESRA